MEILNRNEIRADKRELVKKAKKKAEFAKKLTPLQQEYINEVVEAGKENVRVKCINVFDCTVQTALIEKTDFNYEEICDIVIRCGQLMKEAFDALENISFEERIMKVKAIENEVAEDITKMIFNGKTRVEVVKAMREKYVGTGLTTQDINIYWKKGKESYDQFMSEQEGLKKSIEISEALKENDIDKAAEYILGEEKEMPVKTKKESKGKKEIKKVEPIEVKESKFIISNKVVKVISCDVAGEHGEYEINNGVISIKGTEDAFVNILAVQNWASDKREELLKEIDKLNNLEGEVIEVMKELM
ncbi:hypothetical protein [Clostridium sp.]